MKKKAFTLIELIAVLVILAILALIVTPLVMNIIRKARGAADKRSIDAYGRSIELAIATYLLDHGDFPTSVNDLTIEYSGDEVACSTTQLNSDSSVYLADCRVAGRTVDYKYGIKDSQGQSPLVPTYEAYEIGDEVRYNDMNFYVISPSGTNEDSVTLLKSELLSNEEISNYKPAEAGTYQYGMWYGSSSDYSTSYVKITVEAWATDKCEMEDLVADSTGYSVRLLSNEDLTTNLGYQDTLGTINHSSNGVTPDWVYDSNHWYWTMSAAGDSTSSVWYINSNGSRGAVPVYYGDSYAVRPVITIKKIALQN